MSNVIKLQAAWNISKEDNSLNLEADEVDSSEVKGEWNNDLGEEARTPEEITQSIEKFVGTENLTLERGVKKSLNMRYVSCQGETLYISLKFKEAVEPQKAADVIRKLESQYPFLFLTPDFYAMDDQGAWKKDLGL